LRTKARMAGKVWGPLCKCITSRLPPKNEGPDEDDEGGGGGRQSLERGTRENGQVGELLQAVFLAEVHVGHAVEDPDDGGGGQ